MKQTLSGVELRLAWQCAAFLCRVMFVHSTRFTLDVDDSTG